MDAILVLAATESDGRLGKPALEALGAAKDLGGELVVGLFGAEVKAAAGQIAACGAGKFLGVAGVDFGPARYGTDAAAAEAIAKASGAAVVIAPATSRMNRVLAGVAARLGGRIDTHATAVKNEDGAIQVSRWYYRQRMEGVVRRTTRPWVIALDPGSHAPWTGAAGSAAVEAVAVDPPDDAKRTEVLGVKAPPADEQTIRPDAPVLFVAGAGWTKKQPDGGVHADAAAKLILGFLKKTQASLGGSKSVVDMSGEGAVLPFMTHLNQIGQTGATPRHPKGLATCCHGEEPHTVGWRFIAERRAVNLDPNCGWARGKADVLYVADAFAVMARVNALLSGGT